MAYRHPLPPQLPSTPPPHLWPSRTRLVADSTTHAAYQRAGTGAVLRMAAHAAEQAMRTWGRGQDTTSLADLEGYIASWTKGLQEDTGYSGELLNHAFATMDEQGAGRVCADQLCDAATTGSHRLLWQQLIDITCGDSDRRQRLCPSLEFLGTNTTTTASTGQSLRQSSSLPRIKNLRSFKPTPPSGARYSPLHKARFQAMVTCEDLTKFRAAHTRKLKNGVWVRGNDESRAPPGFLRSPNSRLDRSFVCSVNTNHRTNADVSANWHRRNRYEEQKLILHTALPPTTPPTKKRRPRPVPLSVHAPLPVL